MEKAKVCTIISITARKEAGLEEFIGSVLEQDYPLDKIELIIVDKIKKNVEWEQSSTPHTISVSTDQTQRVCPATARNFAISLASGLSPLMI